MRMESHGCSVVPRKGKIVVQALQLPLPSTGKRLVLGVSTPEEVVRMHIGTRRESDKSRDDMVGNDHDQRKLSFLCSEAEPVSLNPRFGAHQGVADTQPCPAHELDDR